MNFAYQLLLPGLLFSFMAAASHAQEAAGEEEEKRVQYQLVLPEEKTPENVKPEEHNPFESENEAMSRQSPGDSEENRVRDKLLKLPVVGTKRMTDGRMRVLLGDIILETGSVVPDVLPDQLVELKVKNITPMYIELAWQEKRLTGLPPKIMQIPINIAPQVRYQMFGQSEAEAKEAKGANAIMDLPLREPVSGPQSSPPALLSAEPAPPRAQAIAEDPQPATLPPALARPDASPAPPRAQVIADDPQPFTPPRLVEPPSPSPVPPTPDPKLTAVPEKPLVPAPTATPPPPPSPAVESVVRMLFGNPTPAPK